MEKQQVKTWPTHYGGLNEFIHKLIEQGYIIDSVIPTEYSIGKIEIRSATILITPSK